MRELINLRHLENDVCDAWSHMPHEIEKLTSLQSLSVCVIENGIGWLRNYKVGSLSELEIHDQLREELHIKDLQNVRDVVMVSRRKILEKKNECLESLKKKREAYHRVRYIVDGIEKTISLGLGIHIRRN